MCIRDRFYFSLEEDAGSLARTAGFEIRPDSLSDEQKARIKGIQGHLWTCLLYTSAMHRP